MSVAKTEPLSIDDLCVYIRKHDIQAQLLTGVGHTPTVPAAAAVLGVETEQIIKTLLFQIQQDRESDPMSVVVISNGESRVDKTRLAQYFDVGKKRVKLASPATVLELLGYPAGGVPPFGHRNQFPVIIDESILSLRYKDGGMIYGGGGDDQTMMALTVEELLRVVRSEILVIS